MREVTVLLHVLRFDAGIAAETLVKRQRRESVLRADLVHERDNGALLREDGAAVRLGRRFGRIRLGRLFWRAGRIRLPGAGAAGAIRVRTRLIRAGLLRALLPAGDREATAGWQRDVLPAGGGGGERERGKQRQRAQGGLDFSFHWESLLLLRFTPASGRLQAVNPSTGAARCAEILVFSRVFCYTGDKKRNVCQ